MSRGLRDTNGREPDAYFGYVGEDGYLVVVGRYAEAEVSAMARLRGGHGDGLVLCRAYSYDEASEKFRRLLRTNPEWFRRMRPSRR